MLFMALKLFLLTLSKVILAFTIKMSIKMTVSKELFQCSWP